MPASRTLFELFICTPYRVPRPAENLPTARTLRQS